MTTQSVFLWSLATGTTCCVPTILMVTMWRQSLLPVWKQQPLQEKEKLDPQQHKMFRTTVGQLIWASLDRPDLMYCAKLHSSRLQGPTERDLRSLKHTLRYIKGTTHYKLFIGRGLADYLPTTHNGFCHFPAEQHPFGSTLLHWFRLGWRQNYETFYKWMALFTTWNTFELR